MTERLDGITSEQEHPWTVEVYKVGDAPFPWEYATEVTYRSNGEKLQKQERQTIRFDDKGCFNGELIKAFMDEHSDTQLVWVPGQWVNTDLDGYVSQPEVKLVGWLDVNTPEQFEDYEYHKADHAKRFPST